MHGGIMAIIIFGLTRFQGPASEHFHSEFSGLNPIELGEDRHRTILICF